MNIRYNGKSYDVLSGKTKCPYTGEQVDNIYLTVRTLEEIPKNIYEKAGGKTSSSATKERTIDSKEYTHCNVYDTGTGSTLYWYFNID